MAKLVIRNKEYPLADGAGIADVCQAAGLTFNCHTGVCGSCLVKVSEGADNLSRLTAEEDDLGLDPNRRLACQCRIERGTVKIDF